MGSLHPTANTIRPSDRETENDMKQEARARIRSQAPQEEKIAAASVVIRNESTYLDTWKQVLAAWQNNFHKQATDNCKTPATHDNNQHSAGKTT
jgi:hypothetical protein